VHVLGDLHTAHHTTCSGRRSHLELCNLLVCAQQDGCYSTVPDSLVTLVLSPPVGYLCGQAGHHIITVPLMLCQLGTLDLTDTSSSFAWQPLPNDNYALQAQVGQNN
jgi:hypothetical protein